MDTKPCRYPDRNLRSPGKPTQATEPRAQFACAQCDSADHARAGRCDSQEFASRCGLCVTLQVHSKLFSPVIAKGLQLAFHLRVNPVVTHSADGKSRRDDVVMHRKKQLLAERELNRWSDWTGADTEKPLLYDLVQESCKHWFDRRAETCGFRLLDSDAGKQLRVDGYLQQRADQKGIRFSTVDFSGALEVVDPQLFGKSLFRGIGKAKAFGCGLMLIRRL